MDTGQAVLRGSSRFHQRTELSASTFVSGTGEVTQGLRTLARAIEPDVELLHAIIHQCHFIV
jgi:hypothetical protein